MVKIYIRTELNGFKGNGRINVIMECEVRGEKIAKQYMQCYKSITRQRLELKAVVEALNRMRVPCDIEIYTDSKEVAGTFRSAWVERWIHNGWISSKGRAIKNDDLWKDIAEAMAIHNIDIIYREKTEYGSMQHMMITNMQLEPVSENVKMIEVRPE